MYFLAIVAPPLAVIFTGRVGSAFLNIILTLCIYVPGMIHAIFIVQDHKASKRHKQYTRAVDRAAAANINYNF